jgi:hypothetical protein
LSHELDDDVGVEGEAAAGTPATAYDPASTVSTLSRNTSGLMPYSSVVGMLPFTSLQKYSR